MIRLPGRRSSKAGSLPPQVGAGLGLLAADQVLASGVDSATGGYAVLSQHHLSLVSPTGRVAFSRPWHEVRSGSWDPVTGTISATWAAGGRGTMLTFGPGHDHVADVFRERVQASVVTSEQILLYDDDGPASAGRVSLRKDLATQELLVQVHVNRGVRREEPSVAAAVDAVVASLWEQVGHRVPEGS